MEKDIKVRILFVRIFYVGMKYLFVCEKELICIESIKISFISIKLVINMSSQNCAGLIGVFFFILSQLASTCSKLTIETLEQGVKCV